MWRFYIRFGVLGVGLPYKPSLCGCHFVASLWHRYAQYSIDSPYKVNNIIRLCFDCHKAKKCPHPKKNPNFKFFTMSFSLPPLIRSSMESITCFVCTGDDNSPLNIYYLGIYHPFLSVSESMIPYFLFIANFASRNFPLWLLKFMSTEF